MKTEIYEAFDDIKENFDSIDDQSIINEMDMEIDIEKIKAGVMAAKTKGKKKMGKGKKTAVILAAAALSAGIIGTTVFAAFGGLDSAFGNIFSGDMNAAGLYSGGNVSVNTDDENLEVKPLGIAGDDETVYAAIELTHKDGSAFTHSDLSMVGLPTETEFVHSDNDYESPVSYIECDDEFSVYVDKNLWQQFNAKPSSGGGAYSLIGGWEMLGSNHIYEEHYFTKVDVEDNGKKLVMYIKVLNKTNTLKGNTLYVSFKSLSEYVPVKYLGSCEEITDEVYEQVKNQYYDNDIDVSYIKNDKNGYDIWEIENKKTDVNFSLSLKLNYKSDVKTASIDDESANSLFKNAGGNISRASISATAFGISIRASKNGETDVYADTSNITVVTKDGKEYGVAPVADEISNDNIYVSTEYFLKDDINYHYLIHSNINESDSETVDENFDHHKVNMIDINRIEKVIIGGKEIYLTLEK